MSLPRLIRLALGPLIAGAMLSGCPDGRSPNPPPRVPKPKVEREAVDPIKTGPAAQKTTQEV